MTHARVGGLRLPAAWPSVLVATWFAVLSVMRIRVLSSAPPGFDARLYLAATVAWLHGQDPWTVHSGAISYAAPPPSLLAMLPFTVVPDEVAVAAIIILGLVGTAWALRRLGMPLWWLAFPPFVDGLYNANPQVLVVPLLVAGAAPLAVLVKLYAGAVPIILGQLRAVVLSIAVVVVTIPLLPWSVYVAHFPALVDELRIQSDGGMSALATPVLIPVAVVALILMGRKRAAWWAIPVLWPSTQWYYTSMVVPGATLLGGVIAAIPNPWAATLAAAAVAAEVVVRRRRGELLDGATT